MRRLPLAALLIAAAVAPGCPEGSASAAGASGTIEIETAVRKALARSPELRLGDFERRLAAQRLRLTARSFLPTLALEYAHNDSVSYGAADSRTRRLTVTASQLLYGGGRLTRERRVQQGQLKVATASARLKSQELALSVVALYTDILRLGMKQKIEAEARALARKQLAVAREERALGVITELDLLDLEVAVSDLELQQEKTAQEERVLLFRFARLLGYPPESPPRPAGSIAADYAGFLLGEEEPLEKAAARYLERTMRASGELLAARLEAEQSRRAALASRWSWLPQVRLVLAVSMSGDRFPLSEPGFSAGLEMGLDLPVLPSAAALSLGSTGAWGRSRGFTVETQPGDALEGLWDRSLAELKARQAALQLEELYTQLRFDIAEELAAIRYRKRSLALLRRRLAVEEARLEVQRLRVELGEIRRVDLVTEEIDLAGLRIEVLDGAVALYAAEAALLQRAGGAVLAASHALIVRRENP